MKLNQVIAIEKGTKNQSYKDITEVHQLVQKHALLVGISRTYQPKDEEGERLPAESTRVQVRAEDVIQKAAWTLTKLFDIVATKDWSNCAARANVVVDGKILLDQVPITYLLFLEKQLNDIHTFIQKIPMLDQSESWRWDAAHSCWATEPAQSVKTKKIPRNHVKYEATEKHPAQVDVYYEDVPVGTWTTTRYCSALSVERHKELMRRVEKLMVAVKFAREEANNITVTEQKTGDKIFDYLFGL